MERNKIEDLFRDKLEGYNLEPSIEARDRFQGMIQRMRRKVMIRRIGIAASILLFTFAGIYSVRTLNTDKIDLAKGEFFDTVYNTGMAAVNEVPEPGLISPNEDEKTIAESEMVNEVNNPADGASSTENSKAGSLESNAVIAQANENEKFQADKEQTGFVVDDRDHGQLSEEHNAENSYIEYYVADPDLIEDENSGNISIEDQTPEPMKITIEYIASGNKDEKSESKSSNFYSKLDKMKTVDEVLGDIRTYKDRLFALDFKREEKVNNQEK